MLKPAVILALIALVMPTGLLGAEDGEKKNAPRGLPAEVTRIEATVLERTLEAVGSLRANEAVVIRPEQTGRIAGIHFDEGTTVKRGQTLFTLEASTYKAAVAQARASEKLSKIEYDQAEELLGKKLGSRHARDSALAQLQINQAITRTAITRLEKMTIHAPFSGQTGLRDVSVGDYVNSGDQLVELVDLSQIKTDFSVPEVYLAQLKVGQLISFSIDAFPGELFHGEIYAIAPQIDVRGRSLALRARVPNDDGRLRPGLFARVKLILERKEQALLIPEQAIVPRGRAQLVYKVVDGKVQLQPVRLGLRQRGRVEVLEGIRAGDVVVTAGQLKLRPGAPVTPIFADRNGADEGGA